MFGFLRRNKKKKEVVSIPHIKEREIKMDLSILEKNDSKLAKALITEPFLIVGTSVYTDLNDLYCSYIAAMYQDRNDVDLNYLIIYETETQKTNIVSLLKAKIGEEKISYNGNELLMDGRYSHRISFFARRYNFDLITEVANTHCLFFIGDNSSNGSIYNFLLRFDEAFEKKIIQAYDVQDGIFYRSLEVPRIKITDPTIKDRINEYSERVERGEFKSLFKHNLDE